MTTTTEPVWVIELRPGAVLTDPEWRLVVAEAAAGYGLGPDMMLTTPYGYAPMPRPPAGEPNGMGKVPAGIRYDVALHPVFWLDANTRRRRKGEDDDLYTVRLALTLTELRMIDPATQEPANPFLEVGVDGRGVDTDNPEVRQDISDYMNGASVGWLQKFQVGPLPQARAEQIDALAVKLIERHRSDYYEVKQAAGARLDQFLAGAVKHIESADLQSAAAPVLAAGDALLKNPSDRTLRKNLDRAVTEVLVVLGRLDDAAATVGRAVEKSTHGRPAATSHDVHRKLDQRASARREHIERQVAVASVNPSPETLRALWTSLKATWDKVHAEASEAASRYQAVGRR